MPLVECAECKQQISDQARSCPKCGCPNQTFQTVQISQFSMFFGWEYRSKLNILGIPLIHIAQGINPETRAPRVAKGIIAIGNIAIGVFALGGISLGGLSIGGLSLGIASLGGISLGGVALGGLAAGYIAIGGLAIGQYALGGAAFGVHSFSGISQDPEVLRYLEKLLGMKAGALAFPTRP